VGSGEGERGNYRIRMVNRARLKYLIAVTFRGHTYERSIIHHWYNSGVRRGQQGKVERISGSEAVAKQAMRCAESCILRRFQRRRGPERIRIEFGMILPALRPLVGTVCAICAVADGWTTL
jgi:hypothetical protein